MAIVSVRRNSSILLSFCEGRRAIKTCRGVIDRSHGRRPFKRKYVAPGSKIFFKYLYLNDLPAILVWVETLFFWSNGLQFMLARPSKNLRSRVGERPCADMFPIWKYHVSDMAAAKIGRAHV